MREQKEIEYMSTEIDEGPSNIWTSEERSRTTYSTATAVTHNGRPGTSNIAGAQAQNPLRLCQCFRA